VVIGLTCLSAYAEGKSHCSAREKSIWSCSTKRKTYELCASQDLGKTTGYLQYRAGRIGKIELVYPAGLVHPKGPFLHRLYARNAALIFRSGRYEYELFDALVGGSELRVQEIDGKMSRDIICDERNETFTDTATNNFFKEVGINE
jgi:hypothetical protein